MPASCPGKAECSRAPQALVQSCLHTKPAARPPMAEVLARLRDMFKDELDGNLQAPPQVLEALILELEAWKRITQLETILACSTQAFNLGCVNIMVFKAGLFTSKAN